MFEIIYILIDKKKVTASELAQRLEVSTRTVYRDVERLSLSGIPVYMTKGKGGGISILENFILNKAMLTDEEKSNILIALKAVNGINVTKNSSVLNKLRGLFGEYNTDWIDIDYSAWYGPKQSTKVFDIVKQGILEKRILKITYASARGEELTRVVEPIKIYFRYNSMYLYAYCRLRKDFRLFKLSRVKNCVIENESFIEKVFFINNQKKYKFQRREISLKLHISKKLAYRVYDEFDNYDKQDDGSFIVHTKMMFDEYLISYMVSFGNDCEILEPIELRTEIRSYLEKILKHYS